MGFWTAFGVVLGRLGTSWGRLGVSWARFGRVLAVLLGGLGASWLFGGLGTVLGAFWNRLKLVLGFSGIDMLMLLQKKSEYLRGQSKAPDAKKAHQLKLC